MSSGTKNLLQLVGGWVLALAVAGFTLLHQDEIRTALGLKLGPADFGIASEPEPRVAALKEDVSAAAIAEAVAKAREEERSALRREDRRRPAPRSYGAVELQRSSDGHFHAEAYVNGRSVPVLIDTGATLVALSYEDAMSAGISVSDSDFTHWSNTANGRARFAPVMLEDVRIGDVVVRNVRAAVSEPGKLTKTLLGMSFLGQTRMKMQGTTLVLEQ